MQNNLYGITMQESGVSKLLVLNLISLALFYIIDLVIVYEIN